MTREHNSWFIVPLLRAAANNVPVEGPEWRAEDAGAAQEVVQMLRPQLEEQGFRIAHYVGQQQQEAALARLDGKTTLAMGRLFTEMTFPRREGRAGRVAELAD